MNLNWSDYVLVGKQENIPLKNHLLNVFLEDWSTEINYTIYFHKCTPSFCTYTTIVETNFIFAFMLLISLYGGLVLVFRLIAPFLVNVIWKLKHGSQKHSN